jgi:hypothetical protein
MYSWIIAMALKVVIAGEPVAANTALERLYLKMRSNVFLHIILTL